MAWISENSFSFIQSEGERNGTTEKYNVTLYLPTQFFGTTTDDEKDIIYQFYLRYPKLTPATHTITEKWKQIFPGCEFCDSSQKFVETVN